MLVVVRDTWIDFGVTWMYIMITNPSYSTGSHNVIIVLVKFLLIFVFIIDMLDGSRGRYGLLPDIH